MKSSNEYYGEEESKRRAREAIQRSFAMPYKPQRELVGTTKRAKKMAATKKAKGPKSP